MLLYVIDIDGFEMKAEKKRIKSDVRREKGTGEWVEKTGRNLYGSGRKVLLLLPFFFREQEKRRIQRWRSGSLRWRRRSERERREAKNVIRLMSFGGRRAHKTFHMATAVLVYLPPIRSPSLPSSSRLPGHGGKKRLEKNTSVNDNDESSEGKKPIFTRQENKVRKRIIINGKFRFD